MKDVAKMFGFVICFFMVLFSLMWMIQGNAFFMYKFFAPKQEQVRREVFEETKSYRQGMVQELQNMQFEYVKASPEHKSALRGIILHRAADFPPNDMPYDLAMFINQLKNERTMQ